VAGWDAQGNLVASGGRSITGRNLSYAYAATTHACEGATGLKVITGFDRHSVRSATRRIFFCPLRPEAAPRLDPQRFETSFVAIHFVLFT
jgi:hypothetical protein